MWTDEYIGAGIMPVAIWNPYDDEQHLTNYSNYQNVFIVLGHKIWNIFPSSKLTVFTQHQVSSNGKTAANNRYKTFQAISINIHNTIH